MKYENLEKFAKVLQKYKLINTKLNKLDNLDEFSTTDLKEFILEVKILSDNKLNYSKKIFRNKSMSKFIKSHDLIASKIKKLPDDIHELSKIDFGKRVFDFKKLLKENANSMALFSEYERSYGIKSIIVKNGKLNSHDNLSDFGINDDSTIQENIENALPSVGRIGISDFSYEGTGWLISDDIIVTNAHVVKKISKKQGNEFHLKNKISHGTVPFIDFKQEFLDLKTLKFKIKKILYMNTQNKLDIAFLKIENITKSPKPMILGFELNNEKKVGAIGYPQEYKDEKSIDSVFNTIYEIKRFSPGKILSHNTNNFMHNCSTKPGSSGSPIIDMNTGYVLGMHLGWEKDSNDAIKSIRIKELLNQ